ncbi:TIGR00341 family protein [Prosthecochloris sp. N3]|uniref:TIGR00341 family protein n=1 Tax=Prosthecochloris ethylica TaxID=2743976 RepID=A0ABR9XV12_9CHLB|nr:TIGR00341 family protein [Prosthecochloris ethylica]MBF0585624.1 TIGR00341 family protein [Prosthecochloris ethylica]MBF0637541.1 TIGR00341 family protein [Prosthecochloris ethylica]NUK48578.1 TIGR00341 family protein [Prosthecochloris ethylica]
MKLIEVIADEGSLKTVEAIAEKQNARDFRVGRKDAQDMQLMRMVVSDDRVQDVLDALQGVLGAQSYARLFVYPIDISLPKQTEEQAEQESKAVQARESLYREVQKNSRLDMTYLVLVMLSTVVAAIGLIENNVAVVIGAMVIAPLLGPNLAFGLGTALGDLPLMKNAFQSLSAGVLLALTLSVLIGVLWPFPLTSPELLSRTDAGMDSIALAFASGAAAALSLSTGLPSVLVGVMVAVALLPPAATCGLMIGHARFDLASGAALLLAVNVVSVNLACKLVFLFKGIGPRTWLEKAAARKAMRVYILIWVLTLLALALVISARTLS